MPNKKEAKQHSLKYETIVDYLSMPFSPDGVHSICDYDNRSVASTSNFSQQASRNG